MNLEGSNLNPGLDPTRSDDFEWDGFKGVPFTENVGMLRARSHMGKKIAAVLCERQGEQNRLSSWVD